MFSRDSFTLFWSVPPDQRDWDNLAASGCTRVMMMLPHAVQHPDVAVRLGALGMRLVLRVPEESYYDNSAPGAVARAAGIVRSAPCVVDAVIVGCEPEWAVSFEYGSPSWGQQHAYEHRARFDSVRVALQAEGFRAISPGWTMRSISEGEPAQPGMMTWREICCLPTEVMAHPSVGYLDADGCGAHLYAYGWDGPADELRLLFALRWMETMWHRPIWIDEIGIGGKAGAREKMRAYIEIASLLLRHPLGRRVEMLCPFVANGDPGNPPAWDARFLIRDQAAYQELGVWMRAV